MQLDLVGLVEIKNLFIGIDLELTDICLAIIIDGYPLRKILLNAAIGKIHNCVLKWEYFFEELSWVLVLNFAALINSFDLC